MNRKPIPPLRPIRLCLLPLALLSLAHSAWGAGRNGPDPMGTYDAAPKPRPKCKVFSKNDPFGISAALKTGPHEGECIDTDEFRSVKKLTEMEEKSFFTAEELTSLKKQGVHLEDPKTQVVANFLGTDSKGKNHYYVAVIPTQRVHRSIVQLVSIAKVPPISHGQVRFDMSGPGPGIILIDQSTKKPRVMKELHDDVVLTLQGVHSLQQGKDLGAAGLQPGFYSEEISIGSNRAQTVNWVKKEKLTAYQYVGNFTAAQSRAALVEGIRVGHVKGVTAPYDVFNTSCSNLVFELFHKVTHTPNIHVPMQSVAPMESMRELGWINHDGSSQIETIDGSGQPSWLAQAPPPATPAPKKKHAVSQESQTAEEELNASAAR